MYVADITRDVHGLVIADQHMHPTASTFGLPFQLHQVPHDLERVGPAVRHVTQLHEVGVAAGPTQAVVYQPVALERLDVLLVVTMHITDSHDAIDALPDLLRDADAGEQGERQGQQL